jgi:hypothetical protein
MQQGSCRWGHTASLSRILFKKFQFDLPCSSKMTCPDGFTTCIHGCQQHQYMTSRAFLLQLMLDVASFFVSLNLLCGYFVVSICVPAIH